MARRDSDTARWTDERMGLLAPPAGWEPNEARGLTAVRHYRPAPARRRPWVTLAVAIAAIAVFLLPMPALKGFAHACGEFVRRSLAGGSATHSTAPNRVALPTSIGEHVGQVVLVTYSTPDCDQCASEMAWFREFEQRYGPRGFAVVDVRVAPDDRVRAGIPSSIPTTVLVDRAGRVAVRHTGYCSKREFEADIQALLDEH
jgi:thiol-disulfide isomerase/thioredoxin